MRHTLRLSVLASVLVMNVSAADDLASMFKEGKASGQIRAFYIDRSIDYSGATADYSRDGLSLGGKLGYETGTLSGFSMGAMFYTTNKLDSKSAVAKENDATLFDSTTSSGYSTVGQAYLQYKVGNTAVKFGRQELNTPLAGGDDARMLPNTFEALVVSNNDVKDLTLIGAHVSKINYGTFANAYAGGELALTAGYGAVTTGYRSGHFQDMGMAAIGKDTDGVTAAAAIYKGLPNTTLQLWDYYAHDILNAIYAQGDVTWGCLLNPDIKMTGSAQLISESDVGASLANEVDSLYVGVQLAAKYGNVNGAVAYSQNSESDTAAIKGGTITPWGGMPAFTQGMVTRHQFMTGTEAWKVSGGYNFKDMGANVTASAYYASFDVGSKSTYTVGKTIEPGFDVIWTPEAVKNLQLRLRGNFPDKFKNAAEDTSWDEYRFIANYNF
ncbi:MAG: OprD family outer membrane porin [Sulfuricurvum sp.]|nr:OprD family outer membrane porin [Sulfuricurvum sp.]